VKLHFALLLTLLAWQGPLRVGTIEGRVVRVSSGAPIADALVTLAAAGPSPPGLRWNSLAEYQEFMRASSAGTRPLLPLSPIDTTKSQLSAITDEDGRFRITGLQPGRYTVRSQKDGYFAPSFNGTPVVTTSVSVDVEGGQSATTELKMAKGGTISGQIRDPEGHLLPSMAVSAYRVTYTEGRKTWATVVTKTTDDRGEFRLFWLPPGEYYVGATPRPPGVSPSRQDSWQRIFYPAATDPQAAVPLQLRDGEESSGTDIQLVEWTSPRFKISGMAINPMATANASTGITDRSVALFHLVPRTPGLLDTQVTTTYTNALPMTSRLNGEFEIRNVPPGVYDLYPQGPAISVPGTSLVTGTLPGGVPGVADASGRIVAAGVSTRRITTSRTALDVRADVTDVRTVLSEGATLSGEVVTNRGGNIRLESLRFSLQSLDTMPPLFVSALGALPVDAAGKFAMPIVPEGRYTLRATGLPESAYIADIRQGGSSVMDTGFDLDSTSAPLQIVVNGAGGMITGYVQTTDRKPAADVTVTLVPPEAQRKSMLRYRTTVTDADGWFSLNGIAPGSYKIFAWESILSSAWQNSEFLSRYETKGLSVSVPFNGGDLLLNVIPRED